MNEKRLLRECRDYYNDIYAQFDKADKTLKEYIVQLDSALDTLEEYLTYLEKNKIEIIEVIKEEEGNTEFVLDLEQYVDRFQFNLKGIISKRLRINPSQVEDKLSEALGIIENRFYKISRELASVYLDDTYKERRR